MEKKTISIFQNETITIFRCEDLGYEKYKGQYFVLDKDCGYGLFRNIRQTSTKGEILDKYGIIIEDTVLN